MSGAYYNEIDPFAAQWLRNLIAKGILPAGDVDERDIREVEAYELAKYTQCHFFAGIGVWPYALRQSGWSDQDRVWSGSCPCPPFSQAGRGQTCPACGSRRNICHPRKTGHFICLACGCDRHADHRHLWPEMSRLIGDGKPPIFVGEQVASADGRIWLGAVSADLQTLGYAVAGSDICAAGFGGFHIRQREYFVGVADDNDEGLEGWEQRWNGADQRSVGSRGLVSRLADDECVRRQAAIFDSRSSGTPLEQWETDFLGMSGAIGGMGDAAGAASERHSREFPSAEERFNGAGIGVNGSVGERPANAGGADGLEHADLSGQHERTPSGEQSLRHASYGRDENTAICSAREARSFNNVDWLLCRNPAGEPSLRPVEPGTFPLAHGVAARMDLLRAYGNALDAETATEFCGAVREIIMGV